MKGWAGDLVFRRKGRIWIRLEVWLGKFTKSILRKLRAVGINRICAEVSSEIACPERAQIGKNSPETRDKSAKRAKNQRGTN